MTIGNLVCRTSKLKAPKTTVSARTVLSILVSFADAFAVDFIARTDHYLLVTAHIIIIRSRSSNVYWIFSFHLLSNSIIWFRQVTENLLPSNPHQTSGIRVRNKTHSHSIPIESESLKIIMSVQLVFVLNTRWRKECEVRKIMKKTIIHLKKRAFVCINS